MNEPMRLHLIDGTYELFRAHYAPGPGAQDPAGADRKALVGMVRSLLALLADPDEAVTHFAVAFDYPIESFRNERFEGYKTGEGIEPGLAAQLPLGAAAIEACGGVAWVMDRYEADDALATGAARFASEVEQVRLLTPDKDLAQCVEGQRVVMVDRARRRVLDEAAVREKFGVGPAQIPDYLGLVGDSADGIPGLKGFGAKSAAALLQRWDSVQAIPRDPAAWDLPLRGAKRLSETLEAGREDHALYRELATLVRSCPLEGTLEDLRWGGVPRDRFEAWCRAHGGVRLIGRPRQYQPA